MEFERQINEAKEIAKNGTKHEKEVFVNFACSSIRYLTEQLLNGCGDKNTTKALKIIKAQYKAYLEVINNED